MSDEMNREQDTPNEAPEETNENVTYHYKYSRGSNVDEYGSGANTEGTSDEDQTEEIPRYAHYQVDEEIQPEKPKSHRHHRIYHKKSSEKSSGFGRKAGNTITLAVIFGLVAGLVFQGVNFVSDKYVQKGTQVSVGTAETLLADSGDSSTSDSASEATVSTGSAAVTASEKGPVAGVAQAAMPSVVAITSVSMQEIRSFFGYGMEYPSTGSGSGIIVGENDDELLIATNNHVVEGATTLSVCFIGSDLS